MLQGEKGSVDSAYFRAKVEVEELHLMGIVAEADSAGLPYPIRFALNEELIQMLIRPAEGNLKCIMPTNPESPSKTTTSFVAHYRIVLKGQTLRVSGTCYKFPCYSLDFRICDLLS